MLGLHHGSVVSADTLVELLWGEDPPRTAAKALQTHISALRRALGDGFVLTQGTGWAIAESEVDASRYKSAARLGRDAAATGDISQAVARFEAALALWRGIPELPDSRRGTSEKTRWLEGHAALVEDRADALLASARAAEIIGELESAVAEAPLRERRWGQLMLALYRAGRQGDALGAYQRARTLLADELGIDPGPELRRLETAIVAQDASLDVVVAQQHPSVMRAVTFLLTDIEGSTAAWEADAEAMAVALARHDELAEQVVTARGGRLIKTRGEGDATFSVFERPSAAAAAAMELQDAISREQWNLREPMRIRIALHTGEVELRDGDYFGRAVNRAARLKSLAAGGQILCSGATAELVVDSLPDDVVLADLGLRELRNLARPEHVFELRLETAEEGAQPPTGEAPPMERPGLPSVLIGGGPFVGRGSELERLLSAWQTSLGGGACAALIAGEPGVGKTRLAGEWSRLAYEQGAVVLYGRCDEDLGAPYQPFAEALRSLVPCVGTSRLRGLRGVEALLPLVPGLTDVVPDLAAPTRADPDTERYALFDAVVALLEMASTEAPVVLVLDDLHWAAKPTLLLLRHVLRFGDRARLQIVGTYRSTDLDRSHPLAAMLADLHRDGTASRISLSGLDEDDVSAYVAKAGYDDEELGHALASVTGGNPFFLIEALRHVDESGGVWDPSTLPQGVREAVSRRLSRLPIETNKALAAAAVVGSRFALDLVERVVGDDLVDAFDEASKAGIVIEEPGGRYRFNHAIVRQSLLAELPSMRRMRLHQRIATTLEEESGADDELLAELAHHYFECAWAGNAAKAVEYCRRAADQAMARLAYEGAADLYDHALHALDEIDDELPDRGDQVADLLVARCEALLAAGDVASAAGAVSQLQQATVNSARLSAWATCFDGQLSVLVHPERLDDVEAALGAAAQKLAEIDDAAGEAKAHTVRATCLARLGRVGDCEIALDDALTAARRARDHRRVNAVLAGAPLAALWGPNPVPRAGGRCLDVVRLLRITTDSPAVEATSTRCQAVLEAFRGRDAAARRMIDSARRTVTELGLRHALLEVEQFAGIVELVLDDPAAAEPHLRQACNGFRRMGLDADTAETAALLGRACLALNRDAEADELATESERLAGHALKASIAWRTLRAQLLARRGDHAEARRVAQAAVTLAERTDGLVDHGDACLSLARVLGAAGDAAGARVAAERAAELYERKGAAALAEKARSILDKRELPAPPAPPERAIDDLDNACVRAIRRAVDAANREDWGEVEQVLGKNVNVESRRKIITFTQADRISGGWTQELRRLSSEIGQIRYDLTVVAIRGERLALVRLVVGTEDASVGAPESEMLQVYGIDTEGLLALHVWFDVDDIDAATAELDAAHARFEAAHPQARRPFGGRKLPSAPAAPQTTVTELDTACVRTGERVADAVNRGDWEEYERLFAPGASVESRRKIVGFTPIDVPFDDLQRQNRRILETGETRLDYVFIAVRGERLALSRLKVRTGDASPGAPIDEFLQVYGIDEEGRVASQIWFDVEDMDAATAELDAVHTRFEDERSQARRLENPASHAYGRLQAYFAARDWDAMTAMLTDDSSMDDRRQVVGAGVRSGRDATMAAWRAIADIGVTTITSMTIAIRGTRLALCRTWAGASDAFHTEALQIFDIDADERMVAVVSFGLDEFDSALEELDARYLAGEAAALARTWSVVAASYAALNRHEVPLTTPDCVNIDHRRETAFGPDDLAEYTRTGADLDQGITIYVEEVHQLNSLAAAITYAAHETSQEGFNAEWRGIALFTVDDDLINRCEIFNEADLDTAIARFEQLSRPAPRLENAAALVFEHVWSHYAARNWDAVAETVAENYLGIDHRRVVKADIQNGRDAVVRDLQVADDVGFAMSMLGAIAIRGERLVLARVRVSGRDPETIQNDALNVVEIDAESRIATVVVYDLDDIDAAIAELDARYLAGEAAGHARTWSVITAAYAGFNRRELSATTPEWVSIDHRRGAGFAPGDMNAYIQAAWDDSPDTKIYIEAVHRLSKFGAVVTHLARGISQEGFDAEWRDVHVLAVEGDMLSRAELFDAGDLDSAIARFEELSKPAPQLENTASRANARYVAGINTRDWDTLASLLAEDYYSDDRRRVTGTGTRRGRDAEIENVRVTTDLGAIVTVEVIATRGDRLILTRTRVSFDEQQGFLADVLFVVETDIDGRIAATIMLDIEDFDAAISELDARYLAGEAAAYSRTWSVISGVFDALKRRELPSTTNDFVDIDHRKRTAFAPGELMGYLRAGWDINQEVRPYVEAVHRLNHLGAVFTHSAQLTSREGFEAEWRSIDIMTTDGDLINRAELFDEADLDAALAKFDQLSRPTPRLENTASQVTERFAVHLRTRDWDAMAELLADDFCSDDRRGVVGAGIQHGRDAHMADMRTIVDLWITNVSSTIIATRGERLVLMRTHFSGSDQGPGAFLTEVFGLVEIDTDERIVAIVSFDLDDIAAAIQELDARYLAGEAAGHAHTWSAITGAYAAIDRRDMPSTTTDFEDEDHRRGAAFERGSMIEYLRAGWDLGHEIHFCIEATHRLSDLGAVVTHTGRGTSPEGFDAEWREVMLFTADGESFSRCEVFGDADLDAALARFEELQRQPPRLENTACRVDKRFQACFAAQDWDALAEMLSASFAIEDRRRVVNMGNLQGRDAELGVHAYGVAGSENVKTTVVATRGQRLVLTHYLFSGSDQRPDAFRIEILAVVEIDADERMATVVVFDADDFYAAIAELDARYLASEGAAHSETWSVIAEVYAALNRGEMPSTETDLVDIDHRSLAAIGSGDLMAYLQAAASEDAPRSGIYVETVHRLTDIGAVTTHVAKATSREGFEAEWRITSFFIVGGDRVNRYEIFDEDDLEAALAGFEELSRPAPRLENTAAQAYDRIQAHFAARDWDGMAEALAEKVFRDDRRRLVGAELREGREAMVAEFSALAEIGVKRLTFDTVAIRGSRLALSRARAVGRDPRADAFRTDVLSIAELDADGRIAAIITFDPDDFDAAVAELDARYLAGEAAAYAHAWSVISGVFAALRRRELPSTTTDLVDIDHRRGTAFAPGELMQYLRAGWEINQEVRPYVEAVHQLNSLGAVVTHAARLTSREGFEAERRTIDIMTVDGDLINRAELFDEADIDAALAKFEQLSPHQGRLKNAASEVVDRVNAYFAARDWAALGAMMATDMVDEDRRRVANAGVRQGRDAIVGGIQTAADLGAQHIASTVIAIRGDRLALCRLRYSGRDLRPEAFYSEALGVAEIDADERVVAHVAFDLDDIDAAFNELDARFVAGEAAAHSRTWSLIARGNAAANRNATLPTTQDFSMIDHRLRTMLNADGLAAYVRASWDLTPELDMFIESAHRLNDVGTVVTHASRGTSQDDFEAEWRQITLFTVEGDLCNRCEIFDEATLDAALARFEELQPQTPRLENAASQVTERFLAHFAAGEWDAMAEILADNFFNDDRRPLVSGVLHGRDAQMANMRAIAELISTDAASTVIATRAARLVLIRLGFSVRGQGPDAFQIEVLGVIEIDTEDRIAAFVVFDTNDLDAAFKELDARYLGGEAAAHAPTWSVISQAYAALNRRALPATTSDWANVDHRHLGTIEPNALTPNIRAFWDITSEARIDIATVHRLTNLGAVVAHTTHATSQEGVEVESGEIIILMVDGDLLSRCEIFNEADFDSALARFEELSPQTRRLEHPAQERFLAHFAARDWDAMGHDLADDYYCDDRRRVVNAGVRHGQDAAIEDLRVLGEIGLATNITSDVIATRGQRLFLIQAKLRSGERPEDFYAELLNVIEIDPEERIAAQVVFDPDDFNAAIAELDARYLAGEAVDHAHTWSVIAEAYAAFNRHELPATDWAAVDRRRATPFESSTMTATLRAMWDLTPDLTIHIEAVHELNSFGAVVTHEGHGSSREGFDAEWRAIDLLTVEGDQITGCEIFDEADLDAALARFEERHPQTRLENAATRTVEQFFARFAVRDWDAMAELLADNVSADDRRSVVNAGIRRGRDAEMANWRATDDLWIISARSTVAIRGEHLALVHFVFTSKDHGPQAFSVAALAIVEIDDSNRIAEIVVIDADDINTAFEELDSRYLAGEAGADARTWSVIARFNDAFNRREIPPTDWVTVDHRRLVTADTRDLPALIRDVWGLTPELKIQIEAVHRLSSLGAVMTRELHGTSREGFDAEWRMIHLLTVEGDRISRSELFDETDLDAALVRFEELQPQAPRLENAASRVLERFQAHFATRDWEAIAGILTADLYSDDRRSVVGGGIRPGRDALIEDLRAVTDVAITNATSDAITTRGGRLALARARYSRGHGEPDPFHVDFLQLVEIDAEGRIAAFIAFDLEDLDAAFTALDARYLAGEAAAHAHIWTAITKVQAVYNRHEVPATTADCVNIDHRSGIAFAPGDVTAYIGATYDVAPNVTGHLEAVHRLGDLGVVVTEVVAGTSQEGFAFEWREVALFAFEGDLVSRFELFDETDLDAALASFDELQPQAPRLENAATRVSDRYIEKQVARDWTAMAEMLADDYQADDRRRVVGGRVHGRDGEIANTRASADIGVTDITATVIATRGEHLALSRFRYSGSDQGLETFVVETLVVGEINADGRVAAAVAYDPDDIDVAFEELDARYLAGEAAAHPDSWSAITQACAALSRHEMPRTASNFVDIDHRHLAPIAPGDLLAYIRGGLEDMVDNVLRVEAVHRLTARGAVVTHTAKGTSREGFGAEWRMIDVFTVEGDLISRFEVFDEEDLDAAIARFDELQPQAPRLENAASKVTEPYWKHYAAREWAAMAELVAHDISTEDRRRVVNAGNRHGRDEHMADMRSIVEVLPDADITTAVMATRGARLVVTRIRLCSSGMEAGEVITEVLRVDEIDADHRIVSGLAFDIDDIEAAFKELDARYLAGEAAAHSHTWTLVTRAYEALNRRQLPKTTVDWVNIDHRRLASIAAGDLSGYLRATWELSPQSSICIEAVHRLSELGAVVTHVIEGTSQQGFDAEWRTIALTTYEDDKINRCELFEEGDLDAALARFEELDRPPGN
jgi:class 3 adenylate cyclase